MKLCDFFAFMKDPKSIVEHLEGRKLIKNLQEKGSYILWLREKIMAVVSFIRGDRAR